MSEFSLEPPVKSALNDADLRERVSLMSADDIGLEQAMSLVEEQEKLREQDRIALEAWVSELKANGSREALLAIMAHTGEVIEIEPEPEPEQEPEPEPEPVSNDAGPNSLDQDSQEEHDSQFFDEITTNNLNAENLAQSGSAESAGTTFAVSQKEQAAESIDEMRGEPSKSSKGSFDDELEGGQYINTISLVQSRSGDVEGLDFDAVVAQALTATRTSRASRINVRILTQASVPVAIAVIISAIFSRLGLNSTSLLLGLLIGSALSFAVLAFASTTKLSGNGFALTAVATFGKRLGFVVSLVVALAFLGVGLALAPLLGTTLRFDELRVAPASVGSFELAAVELIFLAWLALGLAIAFVPELRKVMNLLVTFGTLGALAFITGLAAVDGFEQPSGQYVWEKIVLVAAIVFSFAILAFALVGTAPNVSGSSSKFASALAFGVFPSFVSYVLLGGAVKVGSAESELPLILLAVLVGLGMLPVVSALLSQLSATLAFIRKAGSPLAFFLISASLFVGHFLDHGLLFEIANSSALVAMAILGSFISDNSLRKTRLHRPSLSQSYGFYGAFDLLSMIGVSLAIAAGWFITNPFGFIPVDIFPQYELLTIPGLGLIVAFLLSYLFGLLRLAKIQDQELAVAEINARRDLPDLVPTNET